MKKPLPMDSKELEKIESLFHRAAEISPEKREEFLASACDNSEILDRVRALLKYENSFDSLIDVPPEDFAAEIFLNCRRLTIESPV